MKDFNAFQIILAILAALGVGNIANTIVGKFLSKKRESLEVDKMYKEGSNLVIQATLDVDKIVEQKTAKLRKRIEELEATQIQMNISHTKEVITYTQKLAAFELKFDTQSDRILKLAESNEEMAKRVEDEIKKSNDCLKRLEEITNKHKNNIN